MILTQEELQQQFPSDPVIPTYTQYMVGWYQEGQREFILVFDKVSRHIVFKSNSHIQVDELGKSVSRQRQYTHIRRFYGQENCDPPKQINPELYKGL